MFHLKKHSATIQGGIAIAQYRHLRKRYRDIPFVRPWFSEEVGFLHTAYIEPREKQIDIASLVNQISGAEHPLAFEDRPIDDPNVRCPDISKAKEILGWSPKVSLEEGLKHTYEDFQMRSQIRVAS